MAAFEYTCIDNHGKQQQGVLEGNSPKQVRQQLREQGLIPISVESLSGKQSSRQTLHAKSKGHINIGMLALVTRQLATLLGAGVPLDEALYIIAQQTNKTNVRNTLRMVRTRIMEGQPLAKALAEFPQTFSELYCATIMAGEQTGNLDKVLQRLADHTEQQQTLRQKIQQALIYPSLVTTISILVVIFLLTFVVPKMIAVFTNAQHDLPLITLILISLSHGVKNYGLYILGLLAVASFGFHWLLRKNHVKYAWQKFLLTLPLFGHMITTINVARFSRTLGILVAAGMPVVEAMLTACQVVTHLPIRAAIEKAYQRVMEGETLFRSLQHTGYFPPISLYLIASGENSDQLEAMLEKSADHLEGQVISFISNLLALFEPIIILLMGCIVLFIVLAVLLPIFDLNQLIG